MRMALVVALSVAGALSTARAQQQMALPPGRASTAEFVVTTVPLHHLSSAEAVKLLTPYVRTPGGGVFEVSPNVRAVTIREVQKVYNDMLAVLGQYDREPASVSLTFQLVAADNSTTRDPAAAGVDSVLRGVLKYSGYRLLSSAVATASEDGVVSQTLAADNEILKLVVVVSDLRVVGNDASVHLSVDLLPQATVPGRGTVNTSSVLSTGVTVPVGQTVVLGTTAARLSTQRALILTVRPQLATPAKR